MKKTKSILLAAFVLLSLTSYAQKANYLSIDTDNQEQIPGTDFGPGIKSSLKRAGTLNLSGFPTTERFMAIELSPWMQGGWGYNFNIVPTWNGIYFRRTGDTGTWQPWEKIISSSWYDGKVTIDHNLRVKGKVGIGISDPQNELDVNGTIRAKEVRVESGWADFVFKADYNLPSLSEVKAHIDEHQHLPGIPSEAEVKENGIGLSEISTKLLQKVEELTLYAIQQNETIEKLNKRIDELEQSKK